MRLSKGRPHGRPFFFAWALAVVGAAGCASGGAARPAPPAAASGPATPRREWEGLYLGRSGDPVQIFVDGGRIWMSGGNGSLTAPLEGAPAKIAVPNGAIAITPVAGAGRWRMTPLVGGAETKVGSLDRIVDPYLDRIYDQLRRGIVFTRINRDAERTRDTFAISGPLHARLDLPESPRPSCSVGVLVADPSLNRSRDVSPSPAQPAAGSGGERTFLFLDRRGESGCARPFGPEPTELGMGAGVRMFADAEGAPIAVMLLGYMFAELFVAAGRSQAEITALLPELHKAIDQQAE